MMDERGIGLLSRADEKQEKEHGKDDVNDMESIQMPSGSVQAIEVRRNELRDRFRAIDMESVGVAAAESRRAANREAVRALRDTTQSLLRVISDTSLESNLKLTTKQKLEGMISEFLTMLPAGDDLVSVLREEVQAIQHDLSQAFNLAGGVAEADASAKADAVLRLRTFRAFLKNDEGIDLYHYIQMRKEYEINHDALHEDTEGVVDLKMSKLQSMRQSLVEVGEAMEKISKQYQF